MNVVFLDRDGTLISEPPDEQVDSLEKLELLPGVIEGLRLLCDHGFELVMVTNQDGLGTERFPQSSFEPAQTKLIHLFEGEGISFKEIFICPHMPAENCDCRKPKTGLVREFLKAEKPDLQRSFVVGDRSTDVALAKAIGCRSVQIKNGAGDGAEFTTAHFTDACRYIVRTSRTARVTRTTTETSIEVEVVLDGTGTSDVSTGIGFFDHMLTLLSRHSLIDLRLVTKGDVHVDEHHTVEDTGLALGDAIRQALGDKRGIERYGFLLPMDESLAQTTLDLGGRPYLAFTAKFEREKVGEFPTELTEDFFRAFADGLRANLHITVEGRNDHHKIEAIFKSVARALRQAVALDPRSRGILPSTKGVL